MPPLDTTPDARRAQIDVLRRMTPDERVRIAIAMSEEAREITRSGIRSRHPEWTDKRVERALLESLYGTDLVARAWGPLNDE